MTRVILHVVINNKFIIPFVDFINNNEFSDEHIFLYFGGASFEEYPLPSVGNVIVINEDNSKYKKLLLLFKYFLKADKIILHSLFNVQLVGFLYLFPWFLRKCYWVMWGGDLYYHVLAKEDKNYLLNERWRRKVISKMCGLITYIQGDYELAKKWYSANGTWHECFMYPSNLYKEFEVQSRRGSTINIQVGNSADPTNNHLEVFEKLEQYKYEDIRIIVPLSYGNMEYANEVRNRGESIFGAKFEALNDFMTFEKYLQLLSEIDIAIFNHNRQQAMGNTITLLGLGKKVYMRVDVTSWNTLQNIGVRVFDVANVTLDLLNEKIKQQNQDIVKEYFSKENYLRQLNKLFES